MNGPDTRHPDEPEKRDDSEVVRLIGEIYHSILSPDRFIDFLNLWNRNIFSDPDYGDRVIPFVESQVADAVPLLETSLKEIVNRDELISRAELETRPSLLLTPDCTVIGGNDLGRRLFNLNEGARLDITLMDEREHAEFAAMARAAAAGRPEGGGLAIMQIVTRDGSGTRRSHLAAVRTVFSSHSREGYIVVSGMELVLAGRSRALFQSTFALTDTEMEVVDLVAAGTRPVDIARIRGIREDTVKKQLGGIRDKTRTRTTPALIGLLAGFSQLPLEQGGVSQEAVTGRSVTNSSGQTYTMPRHHKLMRVNGLNVEYVEYGPVSGRPLVMLHASLAGFVLPHPMIDELVSRRFRIIIPFRPGFGVSDRLPGSFDPGAVADHMIAFINKLGINRFAIICGTVAMRYALEIALREPCRVSSITGIGGSLPVDTKELRRRLPGIQRAFLETLRVNRTVAKFLLLNSYKVLLQEGPYEYLSRLYRACDEDLEAMRNPSLLAILAIGMRIAAAQGADAILDDATTILSDWRKILDRVDIPVKLLHGAVDPVYPADRVRRFCESNSQFEFEIFPRCGQLVAYVKPGQVAVAAAMFSDQHWSPAENRTVSGSRS